LKVAKLLLLLLVFCIDDEKFAIELSNQSILRMNWSVRVLTQRAASKRNFYANPKITFMLVSEFFSTSKNLRA
jgi:hypothetical protein